MDRRAALRASAVLAGAAWLGGCTSSRRESGDTATTTTSTTPTSTATTPATAGPPRLDRTIATGLGVPWSIVFLADGSALVSERDTAAIVRVGADGEVTAIGTVPGVRPGGEGGLQGLALAPGDESAVYAYLTGPADNRVVRMAFDGERLGEPEPLLTGLAKAANHNGGALTFDAQGRLYVAVGDAAQPRLAQERDALNGKVLRLDADGRPAAGNPFGTAVWTLGHRNVEGLAWDDDGRLWASEFGDKGADELNLLRAGGNYGWPLVEGESDRDGLVDPLATWPTDEASPAGLAVTGGAAWLAALRGERLWRVPLNGASAGTPAAFFDGELGRLRSVAAAPDGSLWVGTSNTDGRGTRRRGDDRIVRIVIS